MLVVATTARAMDTMHDLILAFRRGLDAPVLSSRQAYNLREMRFYETERPIRRGGIRGNVQLAGRCRAKCFHEPRHPHDTETEHDCRAHASGRRKILRQLLYVCCRSRTRKSASHFSGRPEFRRRRRRTPGPRWSAAVAVSVRRDRYLQWKQGRCK